MTQGCYCWEKFDASHSYIKGLVKDSADYHSKEKLEPGHSLDLKD